MMEGLRSRPAAVGTCPYSALDRLEQGEFIVQNTWICWRVESRLCRRLFKSIFILRVIHSLSNFQVSPICAQTKVASIETIGIPRLELNAVVLLCRLLTWTKQALSLSNVLNRFHDNLDVVKTASIKVEHLYCESRFRSMNFVIECNVASRFFKRNPRQLRLSWTIGGNITIAWFVVERPPFIEAHFHHLAKMWSSDVSRRDDCERNFHRSAKDYRTSIRLCEWVGIAPTIFRAGLG